MESFKFSNYQLCVKLRINDTARHWIPILPKLADDFHEIENKTIVDKRYWKLFMIKQYSANKHAA